jgi:hypothetical protein
MSFEVRLGVATALGLPAPQTAMRIGHLHS